MLLFAVGYAFAEAGPAVPPPNRLSAWEVDLSVGPGTRVAMIVEAADEAPVTVEVRDGEAWRAATETWRRGRVSVHVLDLAAPRAALRFRSEDAGRITQLDWDLFTPTGGEPRRPPAAPPPTPGVLPAELAAIGVIARDDWGADPTECSTTEDDWYRMAIHHTAGGQTYGGTVQGSVQALQAYAMGTGEYCDIPYQFLVGYDGSLWEGRPYDYYSGATGGGNNDGNIAVSFLGCYHPSGCATSHSVTEAMIEGGQRLVQTLVGMHGIPSTSDSIRGHRDWPDNATACPGDWLYDRLDDLRAPLLPDYAATLVALTCDGGGSSLSLTTGSTGWCTLTLRNDGAAAWTPGVTKLAPIPRDVASPLAAPSWSDAARITSVSAATGSGATGTFAFEVLAPSAGTHTLALGLLEEGVTWFADDGGPADGAIAVTIVATDAPDPDPTDPGDTAAPADTAPPVGRPGRLVALEEMGGCGCDTAPRAPLALLAGVGLLTARRRERA